MKKIFEGFAFDCSQVPPVYCEQIIGVEGSDLIHIIDGQTRAIVPVEHAPAYVCSYSVREVGRDNQDLNALRAMHNPIEAPKAPAIKPKKRK